MTELITTKTTDLINNTLMGNNHAENRASVFGENLENAVSSKSADGQVEQDQAAQQKLEAGMQAQANREAKDAAIAQARLTIQEIAANAQAAGDQLDHQTEQNSNDREETAAQAATQNPGKGFFARSFNSVYSALQRDKAALSATSNVTSEVAHQATVAGRSVAPGSSGRRLEYVDDVDGDVLYNGMYETNSPSR